MSSMKWFLIAATSVLVSVFGAVTAVAVGNDEPSSSGIEMDQASYDMGYADGSPGGRAYLDVMNGWSPSVACKTSQLILTDYGDNPGWFDYTAFQTGCYKALGVKGVGS